MTPEVHSAATPDTQSIAVAGISGTAPLRRSNPNALASAPRIGFTDYACGDVRPQVYPNHRTA